ncbi:MAG: thermonuclease family protein [Geminicoccaceae bacterium]
MNHLFPAYLLILTLAGASPALAGSAVGRVSVVDADTLELHGERIRLAAIDAPEARQTCRRDGKVWPCGRRAAFALADFLGSRTVTCSWRTRDRWRRAVAVCTVGKVDVGGWLVEQGWALAYRRYGKQYVAAEAEARAARRGLWAGSFVPPWAWRRGNAGEITAESWPGA